MTEMKVINKTYPLLTMLIGLISFLISGIIFGLMSLRVDEGIMLVFGVPIGSLFMLFALRKLSKDEVLAVIIRSELGGFLGLLTGFTVGQLLSWAISFGFPYLSHMVEKSQIISNISILLIADITFGAFLADLFYGPKSIPFFALICGIASIPFGLLLSVPFKITWVSFVQNLLFTLISFGTTTGLSIGLYNLLKLKKD